MVVHGRTGDPYDRLLVATEADIDLVVINGVPRSGTVNLMRKLGAAGERVRIDGHDDRVLNLTQESVDPAVGALDVVEAITRLEAALADLPNASTRSAVVFPSTQQQGRALLAVEGVIDNGMSPRPHLPYHGRLTGSNLPSNWAGTSSTASLPPLPALTLDPLTAVDNPDYYQTLATELNLPEDIKTGLAIAS
jgi:hypothetical protein